MCDHVKTFSTDNNIILDTYAQYKGRCAARVLHFLYDVYQIPKANRFIIQLSTMKVSWGAVHIASFCWLPGSDVPLFLFAPHYNDYHPIQSEYLEEVAECPRMTQQEVLALIIRRIESAKMEEQAGFDYGRIRRRIENFMRQDATDDQLIAMARYCGVKLQG